MWQWVSLIALCFALLVPTSTAQAQTTGWSQVDPGLSDVLLTDVFMRDTTDAWAVGGRGEQGVAYRLHWDGARWQATLDQTFAQPLKHIVVIDTDVVWAIGTNAVYHRDASGWDAGVVPVPGAELQAMQMFGTTSGWVAGYMPEPTSGQRKPLALHFQDGTWSNVPVVVDLEDQFVDSYILSLHFNQDGGWAVGDRIWHYQGDKWQPEAQPEWCDGGGCVGSYTAVRTINGDEAWAVGTRIGVCAACSSFPAAAHRTRDGWQALPLESALIKQPEHASGPPASYATLVGLYFTDAQHGVAIGTYFDGPRRILNQTRIFRYQNGSWSEEAAIDGAGLPAAISMADNDHALIVGGRGMLLSYGYAAPSTPPAPIPTGDPAAPVDNPNDSNISYFPETQHTLRGTFKGFWQRSGGLPVFGYPLTEEYSAASADNDQSYPTQYFERQRFEYHAENAGTPYEVLLGRLGAEDVQRRGLTSTPAFQSVAGTNVPNCAFFVETGHQVCEPFLSYWRTHGLEFGDAGVTPREALALFGLPISEVFTDPTTGLQTQYFERARFELHPENQPPYNVLLGRLAAERVGTR